MLKAILFDMDETLISIPVSLAYKKTAKFLNIGERDFDNAYNDFISKFGRRPTINEHFELIAKRFKVSKQKIGEAETIFLSFIRANTCLKRGALRLLKDLHKKYALYLISIGAEEKRRKQLKRQHSHQRSPSRSSRLRT